MDIRQIRLFCRIVDRKSFSDAVLKNVPLESMGYDKKDYDRIVAIK